eukprot:scaffold350281_cov42-Prasinocladus_malaysianus.AAC.1
MNPNLLRFAMIATIQYDNKERDIQISTVDGLMPTAHNPMRLVCNAMFGVRTGNITPGGRGIRDITSEASAS